GVARLGPAGAEGVEAAVKLARAATGRAGILSCEGAFHGLGLGTLSLMEAARFRSPFEPLLPECDRVPFGDLDALGRALAGDRYAAFVVEPIQADAAARLSRRGALSLPATRHSVRARRGPDGHGANRRAVRAPAHRRHPGRARTRQSARWRSGAGRRYAHERGRPRASVRHAAAR